MDSWLVQAWRIFFFKPPCFVCKSLGEAWNVDSWGVVFWGSHLADCLFPVALGHELILGYSAMAAQLDDNLTEKQPVYLTPPVFSCNGPMTVLHVWESYLGGSWWKLRACISSSFWIISLLASVNVSLGEARRALLVEQFKTGLEEAVGEYPRGSNNYKQQLRVKRS